MLGFLKKKENVQPIKELKAYVSGQVIPIEKVNDPVFSSKAMGDGIGIKPSGNLIVAPCDGTITAAMDETKHAVGMTLNNGAELLIHVGIDTVGMGGKGFELFVKTGDVVKEGDKLIQFDSELILSEGLDNICILALTNGEDFTGVNYMTDIKAQAEKTIIVQFP